MPYIAVLLVLLLAPPVWASRDVASTDYMDGGGGGEYSNVRALYGGDYV